MAQALRNLVYDSNPSDIEGIKQQLTVINEEYADKGKSGNVEAKVMTYYFEGIIYIIDGDVAFWEKDYRTALDNYMRGLRLLSRFNNSRGAEDQLNNMANCFIDRINGHIAVTKGLRTREKDVRHQFFGEALNSYNAEIKSASLSKQSFSAYIAFGRASYLEGLIWENRGDTFQKKKTGEAKRNYLSARRAYSVAFFIDKRIKEDIKNINNKIKEMTITRIIDNAVKFQEKAVIQVTKGEYLEAKRKFKQSSKWYDRAGVIDDNSMKRRVYLAMTNLMNSRSYEAIAMDLSKRQDKMEEASKNWKLAQSQADRALGLLARVKDKKAQAICKTLREYYMGQQAKTSGINFFDTDEFEASNEQFYEAKIHFQEGILSNEEAKIPDLRKTLELELNDINGFLSMLVQLT
jgi:tetratricopeptide (TPR) repeat protein